MYGRRVEIEHVNKKLKSEILEKKSELKLEIEFTVNLAIYCYYFTY